MARRSARAFAGLHGSIPAVVASWIVAFALVASVAFALRGYVVDGDVRVPVVDGLPVSEARRLLGEAGLVTSMLDVPVRSGPVDVVVEQSPQGGSLVRLGRVIDLRVAVASEARRMPTLIGTSWIDAISVLERAGLTRPDVSFVEDERGYGTVVAQRPLAGDVVDVGGRTAIVVSRGPATATGTVPDLFGVEAQTAAATLRDLGFRTIEVVTVPVASTAAGSVAQQQPPAGSVVQLGRPVVLSVALRGDRFVRVPDVAGLPTWQARAALLAAGLNLGPVESVVLEQAPRGVVGTRPEGLTVPGAAVALIVNVASGEDTDPTRDPDDGGTPSEAATREATPTGEAMLPEGARAIPFLFDPAQMGVAALLDRPYRLTLVVRDDEGERTLLDRTVAAGASVRERVVVIGDEALLQTFVNDVFFQAWRP